MENIQLLKDQKISYITAISTAILAFLAFIAVSFTLLTFIKDKFLGYKTTIIILIFISLWVVIIGYRLKRWILK